jgi:hypothetical protein
MGLLAAVGFAAFTAINVTNFLPMLASTHIHIVTVWLPMLLFGIIALGVEALFIISTLQAWHDVRRTLDDLRWRQVACDDGVAVWGRGRYGIKTYVAKVGRRRLRTPAYALQLPPGAYRYAYLARSGWLLSAQPLATPTPSASGSAQLAPPQAL